MPLTIKHILDVTPIKITRIDMDWTDTGATVFSSRPLPCPLCQTMVTPNVEHRCGDHIIPKIPKPRKKRAKEGK